MYQFVRYDQYDYELLRKIKSSRYKGNGKKGIYSNAIVALDTETSKKGPVTYDKDGKVIPQHNYVVAFTISIRWKGKNYCTLYGHKPTQCIECLQHIRNVLIGDIFVYVHNLAYDYVFLRKFLYAAFGYPKRQLNTKSHNPILLEFENGIFLKDSYILSGRKLEKWANDMDVDHKKAVGQWDYDAIRMQNGNDFTTEELQYIEYDTLACVECIEATLKILHKNISSVPYTVTGIMRDAVRVEGEKNKAHDRFLKFVSSSDTQQKLEQAFHGGYTHGNRFQYGIVQYGNIECYDFTSSYPFIMLAYKLPSTKFCPLPGAYSIDDILADSEEYAFLFKLIMWDVKLKDSNKTEMPYLQFSKLTHVINPVLDNGRVISADFAEIIITEYDLMILNNQYKFRKHACVDVEYSYKNYLPRWYTDLIYKLFYNKSTLKNVDPILYQIEKGKLNAGYGNTVQKPCRVTIEENFITGEYNEKEDYDFEKEYAKYIKRRKSILNYAWGVWITAIAAYNLFQLGKCVNHENGGMWLYSDTDSCYSNKWDKNAIDAYNKDCHDRLKANGYDPVIYEGKEYCPGCAVLDGSYTEYVFLGAKRYCGRSSKDGELHITVAGVPKSGAKSLKDDINNFKMGFIFSGSDTGKLTHSYIYIDNIYIDENGNEIGDSIDLNPCNYLLKQENIFDFEEFMEVDENVATNFRRS